MYDGAPLSANLLPIGSPNTEESLCPYPSTSEATNQPSICKIKIRVMYPNTPGARFDHTYYRDKHMPVLKARMGDNCKSDTIDKGPAGGAPGAPATCVAPQTELS